MNVTKLTRRDLLRGFGLAGTGLVLGTVIPTKWSPLAFAAGAGPTPVDAYGVMPADAFSPGVYLSIENDGTVAILCHRSEMGQGIRSGLPVVLADELEADWQRVRLVQGDGDTQYGNQNTDGSRSIRNFYRPFREAGAVAREMLIRAAAEQWGVDPSTCHARNHAVHHRASGRSLGFGALATTAAALPVPAAEEVKLKDRADFRYIGKHLDLVDGPAMVTGKAAYGLDVRLPGMKVAMIERPPVLGGRVASFDASEAEKVKGVRKVLEVPGWQGAPVFAPLGGVAVVADDTWSAMQGRRALRVEWHNEAAEGAHAAYDSVTYREQLEATAREAGTVVRSHGDVDGALASAAKTIDAEYYVPHLAQAPMEPPCALARVKIAGEGEDQSMTCEVWAPTQNPQSAQQQVAGTLGIDPSAVTIHVTFLGGGFGRKSKPDFIAEAAFLAKEVGAPVQVIWTREDDLRHGYLHSVSAQRLEGGIDADGKVTAWRQRSVFPSIGSTFDPTATSANPNELGLGLVDTPLDIPNLSLENGVARGHARIGWMRSVCNIFHAFGSGSFVDELAHAAGRPPIEVWRELLGDGRIVDFGESAPANYGEPLDRHPMNAGRLRNVLDRVAAAADIDRDRGPMRGVGIAAHASFLSYVAVAIDVSVTKTGKLYIHDAWIGLDCGTYVNPDRVHAQMEGSVVYGLSIALYGEISFRDGAVIEGNFDDYRVLRMHDTPPIHVDIVQSTELPAGVGEPGVPPVAPALTNALFAATGKRYRELPLSKAWLV